MQHQTPTRKTPLIAGAANGGNKPEVRPVDESSCLSGPAFDAYSGVFWGNGMTREAICSCGRLKVICYGEAELVSMCHCLACQRRTGSPYGVAAFYFRKNTEVIGSFVSHRRSSDTGYDVVFHFCGHCGSTVFWEPSRKPDMVAIGVGSFGDPDFPRPSQEVYTECRHSWIKPIEVRAE